MFQVFQKELVDTRTRRQVEISEIDGRLAEKYEAKLQEALQELRDQYESQMAANRQEIELLYENKIKNLQSAANRHSAASGNALDELRQVRTRIDTLTSRISELEGENNHLIGRCRDLEKLLENERMRHADDLAALENDLSRLREEMANQLQEYQDLMDIKVIRSMFFCLLNSRCSLFRSTGVAGYRNSRLSQTAGIGGGASQHHAVEIARIRVQRQLDAETHPRPSGGETETHPVGGDARTEPVRFQRQFDQQR